MSDSRAKYLVLVAAALVAVLGLNWFLSAERQIMKRVQTIAEAIEKAGVESELEAFGRSRTVSEAFSQQFEVRALPFDFSTSERRAVAGQVHLFRGQSERIAVDVLETDLAIEGDRADMMIDVSFDGQTLSGIAGREVFRFRLDWIKESGWKIHRLDLVEIVEESGRFPF